MPLAGSMEYNLYSHQVEAVRKMRSGCILCGGVGSGKTLAALAYYQQNHHDLKLYVITTAKKRDSEDWQTDALSMGLDIVVDSWNNIKKYTDVRDSFFVFDEQRVVGYSIWSKTFIKVAKSNKWILLSATPGDTWMDYIPVFIANGFYKNKTEFINQHVEFDSFSKYPRIKAYHNEGILIRNRRALLVPMDMVRTTTRHRQLIYSEYNDKLYKKTFEERWNIFEDKPIENASELLQCLRRVVATDPDRIWNAKVLMDMTDRIIVFYNYNYELDILKTIATELGKPHYQWNGHIHEDIPNQEQWIYLVQYSAGAEGWNCIDTNTMMFYSLNYSYRMMEQAEGRIDRINTKYTDLEYYILSSKSKIDRDIHKTVINKKNFNATAWVKRSGVTF